MRPLIPLDEVLDRLLQAVEGEREHREDLPGGADGRWARLIQKIYEVDPLAVRNVTEK